MATNHIKPFEFTQLPLSLRTAFERWAEAKGYTLNEITAITYNRPEETITLTLFNIPPHITRSGTLKTFTRTYPAADFPMEMFS